MLLLLPVTSMPAGKAMYCALCVVWCLETPAPALSLSLLLLLLVLVVVVPLLSPSCCCCCCYGCCRYCCCFCCFCCRCCYCRDTDTKDRDTDRETERDTQTQTERQRDRHARDRPERGEGCLSERTTFAVSNQFLSSSPFQSPYRTVLLAAAHETLEALRGV